jgi:hypothetical protein
MQHSKKISYTYTSCCRLRQNGKNVDGWASRLFRKDKIWNEWTSIITEGAMQSG